jgi:PHD/YefM family antitoxin component YafN of YafNO toxin-antitoxin module
MCTQRRGGVAAVVISVDDLTSLEETPWRSRGGPRLMGQIRDSLCELAAGETEVLTKDVLLASVRT